MSSEKRSTRIVVFLGSVRPGRLCDRVGKFVIGLLEKRGYEVDVMDPMVTKFPVLETPIHFYKDPSQVPEWLKAADARVRAADAYVIVSAEYNHNIPSGLSNMLDHFPGSSFAFRPSWIVTYSPGPKGGILAVPPLRTMLAIQSCFTIPMTLNIPQVHQKLTEEGTLTNPEDGPWSMESRANNAIDQLDWMLEAIRERKDKAGEPRIGY